MPVFRVIVLLVATLLVLAPALAKQENEERKRHCEETTKQLDRELRVIAGQLAQARADKKVSQSKPESSVLVKLVELGELRKHLRCLGFRPKS